MFPSGIAQGVAELAKKRGLKVVHFESYAKGTTDFTAVVKKAAAQTPDVIAAATYFDDAVGITLKLRDLNVNAKMFALTAGADLPTYYELVGRAGQKRRLRGCREPPRGAPARVLIGELPVGLRPARSRFGAVRRQPCR